MRHLVTFEGRVAVLPHGRLDIGVTGDNLVEELAFRTPAIAGAGAYLKTRFIGYGIEAHKDALTWDAEGQVWVTPATRAMLAMAPKFFAQVQLEAPGEGDDVIVWQSQVFPIFANETISADVPIEAQQAPYLQQLDLRVQEAAQRAEAAALMSPYIGANGNWYVWNAQAGAFEDTGVSAGGSGGGSGGDGKSAYEVAVDEGFTGTVGEWLASLVGPTGEAGPAGAAATVSVGTVTTGASGSAASVINAGSPSAAVLNFQIPSGPAGVDGAAGANGQSAYQAAQAGGYTGTQADFYADLAAMQGLVAQLAAI